MTSRLNRHAYIKLIAENLDWLDSVAPSLEKDHIRTIIVWSIGQLYPGPNGPPFEKHEWGKAYNGHERCQQCLIVREWVGPWTRYFDASRRLLGGPGMDAPPCVLPEAKPESTERQ